MPGELAGLQALLDRKSNAVLLEICKNLLCSHKHSSCEKLSLSNENSLHLSMPFLSRDKNNNINFGLNPAGRKHWVKTKMISGFVWSLSHFWDLFPSFFLKFRSSRRIQSQHVLSLPLLIQPLYIISSDEDIYHVCAVCISAFSALKKEVGKQSVTRQLVY